MSDAVHRLIVWQTFTDFMKSRLKSLPYFFFTSFSFPIYPSSFLIAHPFANGQNISVFFPYKVLQPVKRSTDLANLVFL